MTKKIGFATAAVMVLGLGSVAAQAATIPLAADAYVRSGAGNVGVNFGTATDINVKAGDESVDANITRKGYLRFDKSSLTGPVNSSVLTLTIQNNQVNDTGLAGAVFHVYGVNNGVTNENFGETTINYTNAPANTAGTSSVVASSVTDLGTFTVPSTAVAGTAVVAASSSALDAFLSADTNNVITFAIVRDSSAIGYNSGFFARENGSGAATLTATSVPEPASLGLLGLGGVALLARRKRR